jgi:hypothetical protein
LVKDKGRLRQQVDADTEGLNLADSLVDPNIMASLVQRQGRS